MKTAFMTLAARRAQEFPDYFLDARLAALGDITWTNGMVKTNHIPNP